MVFQTEHKITFSKLVPDIQGLRLFFDEVIAKLEEMHFTLRNARRNSIAVHLSLDEWRDHDKIKKLEEAIR